MAPRSRHNGKAQDYGKLRGKRQKQETRDNVDDLEGENREDDAKGVEDKVVLLIMAILRRGVNTALTDAAHLPCTYIFFTCTPTFSSVQHAPDRTLFFRELERRLVSSGENSQVPVFWACLQGEEQSLSLTFCLLILSQMRSRILVIGRAKRQHRADVSLKTET